MHVPESKRIMSLLIMLLTTSFVFAQVTVTGNVRDERGDEVIGATVLLIGSQHGVITDVDGNFKLNVPNAKTAVLQISYVGYETQKIALKGKTKISVTLAEVANALNEVMVVAYGTQKKETLTGAISSVKTDGLLRSPNASIASSLAGQVTGLSSVSTSGQPGKEDPSIYIRGVGSLTEGASSPLILVDGVERSFFQMDPNEIESVTVLKDASATAVFGVRGANGVILVTTRRGQEGKATISITSSVGVQQPTRILKMADSYTYATLFNEMNDNDGKSKHTFDDYALERFRLGDDPIMYPNMNWRKYIMKNSSIQTQHNLNISGGTDRVRYFISMGFLWQDGLFRQFKELDYNNNYSYTRYNYRGNLDLDITKSTLLKVGLGGIVGITHEPNDQDYPYGLFSLINMAQPFNSPGIIDGKLVLTDPGKYDGVLMDNNALGRYYGQGYDQATSNTMNMDLQLTQKLDFITKGLSVEVKGAYNTYYVFKQKRYGSVETYTPYYQSALESPGLDINDPSYNKTIVYRVSGQNKRLSYSEDNNTRGRDWYFEASLRYNRKFGGHNVGGLLLYNQSKKYYPKTFTEVPTAYVGLVGRLTYDYKSRYVGEFNFGYNGSENFAPEKRFGFFPSGSIGYVISEEAFMKKQKVVDYLKLRASIGLVGNDNISDNRFLYLSNSWLVDQLPSEKDYWNAYKNGYNFGFNNGNMIKGAIESRIGNPNVSWETALKQNYGIDVNFLNNRLKVSAHIFFEDRKDILIKRQTIPITTNLTSDNLPVVNMGRVKNHGYEIDLKWEDVIKGKLHYYINANVSYNRNKIIFQDEVEPNEPYQWRTGQPVGTIFGYVADGFYNDSDFENGKLKEGLPKPTMDVSPGDVKYTDLNGDGLITDDDQRAIGNPTRPAYTWGLNYGADYKGFFFSMNWTAATERSLVLDYFFRKPFGNNANNALMQFHADNRWTPATAETATVPRFATKSMDYNSYTSSLWVKNGNFLKLKTLTIGYNFKERKALKKLGISQLGIKFSGYNLLTFDSFKIMDPECTPGLTDSYPIIKIYNIGINLTF